MGLLLEEEMKSVCSTRCDFGFSHLLYLQRSLCLLHKNASALLHRRVSVVTICCVDLMIPTHYYPLFLQKSTLHLYLCLFVIISLGFASWRPYDAWEVDFVTFVFSFPFFFLFWFVVTVKWHGVNACRIAIFHPYIMPQWREGH